MATFPVKRNVNKVQLQCCHKCTELTVAHTSTTVIMCSTTCCYYSELKCSKYPLKIPCETHHLRNSSSEWTARQSEKWFLMVLTYFSLCLVQYCKLWVTKQNPYKVPLMILDVFPSREKSWRHSKKFSCLICTVNWGLQLQLPTISR